LEKRTEQVLPGSKGGEEEKKGVGSKEERCPKEYMYMCINEQINKKIQYTLENLIRKKLNRNLIR
jgi:hypothetical protein